jgi:hypothetical protein
MNKKKNNIFTAVKILVLLSVLLSGLAVSMTACTPQQIVTGPGTSTLASPTFTPNVNYVPSSATPNASVAGEVAITGILQNGDSSFSFVNTATLASGTVIYFNNYGWDQTLNSGLGGFVDASQTITSSTTGISEGTISFTVSAGSPLITTTYNQIVIGSIGSDFNSPTNYGTVVNVTTGAANSFSNTSSSFLVMNHNGLGNKIFAYTANAPLAPGASTAGITFINGVIFGPNGWNYMQGAPIPATDFADSYLPWAPAYSFSNGNQTPPSIGFTNFCALDLSTLFNAETNNPAVTGAPVQNQNLVLSTCETTLNGIENGTLWTGNNDSKTHFLIGTGAVANTSCSAGDAGYNVTYSPETSY